MATPAKRVAPTPEGVNFLSPDFYTAGGGIPEGDYVLEFEVKMHQSVGKDGVARGPIRLGVMLTATPADGGDPKTQFYSLGKNADKSFAPNPTTGKGLVAIPGGPGGGLNNSTNWAIFLQQLWDCGLPPEVVSNDLGVLDGMECHMINIPEPESRKDMANTDTDEYQNAGPRKSFTIPVVSEIKSKPWESTPPAAPAKATGKVTPIGKAAPKPVAKAAPAADDDGVKDAAVEAFSTVLGENPNGMMKPKFRVQMFKAVGDDDIANAIIQTYMSSDDAFNKILGELGYACQGMNIKPLA